MKKHLTTILLILIFVVGLSLLLYPTFSDWWNSMHQSKVINDYVEQVANMDEDEYAEVVEAARLYNESLVGRANAYVLTPEQRAVYADMLNVAGNGVMGYIEIPTINVSLPIYHGTQESVLQVAIGHLDWTSLPIGGESTHCVVSGHRGLPSARLFTDLDKLKEGDVFVMRVLNEVLTYEIDQILIVEPHQSEALLISKGQDYCTLVTCTPYGINTHRLMIRGHRIDNAPEQKVYHVVSEATLIEPFVVAPIVAIPMLLILFIYLLLPKRKKKEGAEK